MMIKLMNLPNKSKTIRLMSLVNLHGSIYQVDFGKNYHGQKCTHEC